MEKINNQILILVPSENARGGITNYYYSIKPFLPNNIHYYERGARNWPSRKGVIYEAIRIVRDYYGFIKFIRKNKIDLIQTTTAFYKQSIYRDCLYIILSRISRKKTIVFFRGWDNEFVNNLNGLNKWLVVNIIFKANAIIDLSTSNVKKIKELGFKNNIFLETTLVDENMVFDLNIESLIENRINSKTKNILFLSRIEKTKGIYRLLEVYKELKKTDPNYNLIFAGDGFEQNNLITLIKKQNIQDVHIAGFVTGQAKVNLFKNATVFVFLSEFEGMPNAVLEAMAFGLPVLTTNVGGIKDVFENGLNGIIINNESPCKIADDLNKLLCDSSKIKKIGVNNYTKAKNTFWSGTVAKRMAHIFETILN